MGGDENGAHKGEDKVDVLKWSESVIDKGLEKLGYGEEVYELVKEGIGVLSVKIGVGMDDGWVKIFSG